MTLETSIRETEMERFGVYYRRVLTYTRRGLGWWRETTSGWLGRLHVSLDRSWLI